MAALHDFPELLLMKNNWKEYLSFTKRERTGIVVLLTLIAVVTVMPWLFSPALPEPEHEEMATIRQLNNYQPATAANTPQPDHEYLPLPAHTQATALFEFDPNTLGKAGWRKLGMPERTIRTISRYITKGGRFRKPEDLQKIYGMNPADLQRVLPYVRIQAPAFAQQKTWPGNDSARYRRYAPKPAPVAIDINTADTTAWIALPGIGSRLAQRICLFREKLGGFHSVDQVAETYALPDSTFQRIKGLLLPSTSPVKKIDVNTADINTLKQHPYIRWQLANAIIQYRQQHGPFQSISDLQQIIIITPEQFQRMAPYLGIH